MRWVAPIALVFSLVALGLSISNWQQAESRAQQAEARARQVEERAEERMKLAAETAIRQYDEATVAKYAPALNKIAEAFHFQYPGPPKSVADILVVLFKLLEGLSR